MSSSFTKPTVLKTLAVRGLANRAVPVSGTPRYNINSSILPNKIVVAAGENESYVARVSIIFRAGARYETNESLGAAHVLRIAAGLSTKCESQFAIVRNVQEVGATLTCSVDRETVAYTLEGTARAVSATLPFLKTVAVDQCFKPWEISDNIPRLRLELATRPPQLRALDLLHKAAYHSRGLGHSIYIAKYNLDRISSETLQYHVAQNFLSNRCAVVGLGISLDELVRFAECLNLSGSGGSDKPSEYKGGEIRSDKGGCYAHIAVAGVGGALKNLKEAVAFAILQRVLGAGTYIKYTNENMSPFAKLIAKDNLSNTINAFNVSYSDSGLFGALISAESEQAGSLLEGVVKILRKGNVSPADFERGKRQMFASTQLAHESGSNSIAELGSSCAILGTPLSIEKVLETINSVTHNDINDAANKVSKHALSIASVGNLSCVPFLDEIK